MYQLNRRLIKADGRVRLRSVFSLRIMSRRSLGLIASALVTKIILHRKLSNLGVKLFDLAVFDLSLFDLVRENACHAFNRLPFPRAHLRWM